MSYSSVLLAFHLVTKIFFMNLVFIGVLAVLFAVREVLLHGYANSVFAKWKWNPNFWDGTVSKAKAVTFFGMPVDGPRLLGFIFILSMLLFFNLMHYSFFSHPVFRSFWLDYGSYVVLWEVLYLLFVKRLLYWKAPPAAPAAA